MCSLQIRRMGDGDGGGVAYFDEKRARFSAVGSIELFVAREQNIAAHVGDLLRPDNSKRIVNVSRACVCTRTSRERSQARGS